MPPLQDEQPLWGSRRRAGPGRNLEDVPAPPLFVPLLRHVKSLTSELTSHQELLVELYGSHLRHVSALAETGAEIVQLRQEVTGLDGEVEALRALVKEWTNQPPVRVVMSQDLETPSQQEEPAQSFEALSIAGSVADTDNAMLGSPVPTMAPDDFFTIGNEELARIAADVQQRRERLLGACPSTQSSHTDHTSRRSRASFAVPELLRSALSAMQSLMALTNAEVTEMTRLRLENNRMGTELADLICKQNTEVREFKTALVDLQAQVTRSETALADLTHVENAEVTELKTALADLRAQVARLETGLTAESTKNKRICSAVAEVLERPT